MRYLTTDEQGERPAQYEIVATNYDTGGVVRGPRPRRVPRVRLPKRPAPEELLYR